MYDYNRYMNNGYNSNIIQTPPTPQYQVQCFFVNSKDEAKNVYRTYWNNVIKEGRGVKTSPE